MQIIILKTLKQSHENDKMSWVEGMNELVA